VLAGYSEPSELTGNFAIARYEGGGAPPDSDGDGVADAADACPTVAAATANGCPVVANPFPIPPGPNLTPSTIGTPGRDVFIGLAGVRNVFRAGAGNDRLSGGPLADLLCGEAGADQIDGLAGADRLYGDFCPGATLTVLARAAAAGEGNDTIRGGRGNDRIVGGGGNDKLTGDAGNDRVDGGAGRDKLTGGAGDDRLSGGAGNDTLAGGAGRNRYAGGAGNDKVNAANGKKDRVDCGAGRRDSARVDRNDRVKGCERLVRRR
jgi:Ca2+-binding RTX toxin-like protein